MQTDRQIGLQILLEQIIPESEQSRACTSSSRQDNYTFIIGSLPPRYIGGLRSSDRGDFWA